MPPESAKIEDADTSNVKLNAFPQIQKHPTSTTDSSLKIKDE